MGNNEYIDGLVNKALQSADGAERAQAKPFLFTRIQAAMQRRPETIWEKAGRFIAQPTVAIAGLCLVLAINLAAVFGSDSTAPSIQKDVTVNVDAFSNTVAAVYDIDNNEP